jgi:protein-tyrosine phosphatase
MAQAIFEEKVRKEGLEGKISSDSAGTGNYHIGEQPDARTIKTLKSRGIRFRHEARQAMTEDAQNFDYIVAMDLSNHDDLRQILPDGYENLYLMREFDSVDRGSNVPDPYFGGEDGFEQVYEILDRTLDRFLEKVKMDHKL